ncbi:MAG: Trm112 family protein [Legionella sp.]|nr:MAG: Trm112 family protein [Legionella sp.]
MDRKIIDLLVCPLCKGKLLFKKEEVICRFDRLAFPIRDGIPVMLEQEARVISLEEKDKL